MHFASSRDEKSGREDQGSRSSRPSKPAAPGSSIAGQADRLRPRPGGCRTISGTAAFDPDPATPSEIVNQASDGTFRSFVSSARPREPDTFHQLVLEDLIEDRRCGDSSGQLSPTGVNLTIPVGLWGGRGGTCPTKPRRVVGVNRLKHFRWVRFYAAIRAVAAWRTDVGSMSRNCSQLFTIVHTISPVRPLTMV